MKKKIAISFTLGIANRVVFAGSGKEGELPGFLQGLLHGAGPAEHKWDYIIAGVMLIITVLTLYYSIKWLVRPGEKSPDHIKRTVLEDDDYDW